MSPAQIRLGALRAELQRDWDIVLRQLSKATSVSPAAGEPEAALCALALDHAYQALEQVLVRVERALTLPERVGETWHRALLADASRAVPDVRPALIPAESERDWQEVLAFRHFLRHAYAAELDAARLATVVGCLERAVRATDPIIREAWALLDPTLDD